MFFFSDKISKTLKIVAHKIFTEIFYIFLFNIGVDNLIVRHYTKGNLFLSRNGDRAPHTRKW